MSSAAPTASLKRAATVGSLASINSRLSSAPAVSPGINLYSIQQNNFRRLLSAPSHAGLKCLILDFESTGIVSMFSSQIEIISHEVYLSECLDVLANRTDLHQQQLDYCKAILLVQPSRSTFNALKILLATTRYRSYYIYFTNVVSPDYLNSLASIDGNSLIKEIHEFYSDYYVVSPTLFHFNNSQAAAAKRSAAMKDYTRELRDRDVAGLISLCLSIRRRPDIRYSDSSDLARLLSTRIDDEMRVNSELFSFPGQDATLLFIIDRRDDAVTPLLSQWNYQAMVHELIGIHNNRIDMKQFGMKNKDLEQLILSPQQDAFFKSNQFANFGEMGMKIKSLVADYQLKTQTDIKMDTIEDLQRVIENFPEFRAMSGTVTKHVQLMTELGKIVSARQLMTVSALEQEIVVCNATNEGLEISAKVFELLDRVDIDFDDKLRVVILWSLRFEGQELNNFHGNLKKMKEILSAQTLDERNHQRMRAIDLVLEYGGLASRRSELFKDGLLKHFIKAFKSEIKGVENIYTQHKPLVLEYFNKLLTGDLKLSEFPFVDGAAPMAANHSNKVKYKQIIIFITGGITFEEFNAIEMAIAGFGDRDKDGTKEKAAVALGKLGVAQNINRSEVKFLLGGSCIHNSQSFLQEIQPIQPDLTKGKMKSLTDQEVKLEENDREKNNQEIELLV